MNNNLFNIELGYSLHEGKRYVFQWNFKKVPDPHSMVEYFQKSGIHLAANIKPCLLLSHPRYKEVNKMSK